MLVYLSKKIGYALITLFGVVTVIFFLFNFLPGDPARMMLGQNETAEQLAVVKKKYGFDQPLSQQYLYYLNDLSVLSLHAREPGSYTSYTPQKYGGLALLSMGDQVLILKWPYLRDSFQKGGKPVADVIGETLPNTAVLAVSAILLAIILGILLGVVSVAYKDQFLDRLIQLVSTIGMSVPSFFSALLFAWFFGYVLHDYTHLNMSGSLYAVDDYGQGTYIEWKNLLLPAVVLGIRPLAVVSQLMRNSLWDELSKDYIRTARAKGLGQFSIVFRHALKNALNPVVTAISGWFASMLAGAVFVEYIFGWNGLGKEIVDALNTLDLPIIMGAVLVIATLFIIINIIVDLIYGWLDPRISYQ